MCGILSLLMLPVCWMDPNSEISFTTASEGINHKMEGIGSAHQGGINTVFGDGSVNFISDSIDSETLRTMLRRKK